MFVSAPGVGVVCIIMSVFMYLTPLNDSCILCMILNYLVTITLAMCLSFGASVICFNKYSVAEQSMELTYYAMSLYFMGLGFMFALLISVILGISYGIHQRKERDLFNFKPLQEV